MKKLSILTTLLFFVLLVTSQANAQQMPQVFAVGAIFQDEEASLIFNYNAIESNQPVYERYDVEVVVDYYENNVFLDGFRNRQVNFAEIPISINGVVGNTYKQVSAYILRPVNFCGGLIDWFGFAACYGGNYAFPFTFEGTCAPICLAAQGILLGGFLVQLQLTPVIRLDLPSTFSFTPNMIRNGATTMFKAQIKGSNGLTPGTKVRIEYDFEEFIAGDNDDVLTMAYGTDTSNPDNFPAINPNQTFPALVGMTPTVTSPGMGTVTLPWRFRASARLIKVQVSTGQRDYMIPAGSLMGVTSMPAQVTGIP